MRPRSRLVTKSVQSSCSFVREILAERISEPIAVISRLTRQPLVEELWESPTHLFAVGHAVIPPLSDHGRELTGFLELRSPLVRALSGRLPGCFHLYLGTRGSLNGPSAAADILDEIEREVLNVSPHMGVGEWRTLAASRVPFPLQIYRADESGSDLLVGRRVGDVDSARLARTRRALVQTCPSLDRAAARMDATSVLVLESPDRSRANGCMMTDAILLALSERPDQPDIVLLVETGAAPFQAWMVADRVDLYPAGQMLPRFYEGAAPLSASARDRVESDRRMGARF
jgi:hypothetical protein